MGELPDRVSIREVGPRDGLQIEEQVVPTEKKIEWIWRLAETGVDIIQAGSFVNPSKVPQMADTDSVFRVLGEIGRKPGVRYSGLVLNEKGLERGMASCEARLLSASMPWLPRPGSCCTTTNCARPVHP